MPEIRDEVRELYEAVEKVGPELDGLARQAEEDRHGSPELGAALRRARIPMAKVPAEIGGYELNPPEQLHFFERLAWWNPTAGWIGFIYNGVGGMVGANLPEAGIARVFAEDSPLMIGIVKPSGTATACDGGYRLSGRWSYGSGAHLARWAMLPALEGEDRPPRACVVPMDAIEIHDNWHVAALQGTGSVDVEARDVLVPEEMSFALFAPPLRGGPQYAGLGFRGYVAAENGGFTLGVAQRFLDEVAKLARGKRRGFDANTVATRGAFQYELGRASLHVEAARGLMERVLADSWEACCANGSLTPAEDARLGGALAHATELACEAASRLFPFAGAGSLALSSPIQRCFRDVFGSAQHYLASNAALDAWGLALLEQEPSS